MEFYWVNVGQTINEVLSGNFLWAPDHTVTQSGKVHHLEHWDNVAAVRTGDLIFCCHSQRISHIAKAVAPSYSAPKPPSRSFAEWNPDGHRVDVELLELKTPLLRDEVSGEYMLRFDERTSPSLFTSMGTLKQIYMAHLPQDAGTYLLEASGMIDRFEDALLSNSGNGQKMSKTTRDAIVKARIGQGKFRADLLKRWNNQCSLTGLSNTDLLVASHIHAWSLSTNNERIDPDNGLLLAPHIDRLFDKGLISFDHEGLLLIGPTLSSHDQELFALDRYTSLRKITTGNRTYLARHRTRFKFA
ncbi:MULTISPECIES: HNH endonuclease [unclassified Burkholderia]|uniref:HNH endonuclease n=1 Tax=unclassified Burkholderia TaxID=2613784 RepID=UPI001E4989E2|nr:MULTISPECIES: HNH endonuclease signature motif containing protein [unclassified Burkholderia]UEP31314.1 HNH endonuclease [Burkholderia sp. B21-007]UEP43438.1 HNH endonuclease [Burkholderia sp. B21-005]